MAQPWRRRLTVVGGAVLVLVLLAAVAVAGVRWWQDRHRTDLERALAYAPPGTARFSWTDWAGVRRTLHADLAQAAEREGTSLNQFITAALATKVGAGPDEHRRGSNQTQSRVIAAALVANAVVIGLAAVAAIAVLIVALLG